MEGISLSIGRCLFACGLLGLIVLLADGCGSDSEGQLSKAAYIKKANQICEETKEKTQQGFIAYARQNDVPESGPTLNAKASDFVIKVFTPTYEQQLDRLEALKGGPDGPGKDGEGLCRNAKRPQDQSAAAAEIHPGSPLLQRTFGPCHGIRHDSLHWLAAAPQHRPQPQHPPVVGTQVGGRARRS
jgi:hypothetical protein